MKNLTVLSQSIRALEQAADGYHELQKAFEYSVVCCNDPDNDNLYILKGNQLFAISSEKAIAIATEIIQKVDPNSKSIGVEYLSENGIVYCAYDSGEIIKVDANTPFDQEVAACIDGGLKSMKLSPDQEILVFVTGDNHVITMMSDLEVLHKVNLNDLNFGEKQFVTAGWGHKETQFHGSEGKLAAKAKPVVVGKTEKDSGMPVISWRGDANFFAVSFLHELDGTRHFKVFNREGVLQYTSEVTNGLEEHLAWKPSGNLLAASQQLPNKHVIALFEKNGLKHRDFNLPFKINEVELNDLCWSPDSDILLIWGRKVNEKETFLQFWTENNYHWYLKQTINFTADNPLIYYTWSTAPRAKKRLIILTKKNLTVHTFRSCIDHSRGKSNEDKAVVSVIDGDKVLMTGFKVGIVPPPMSHHSSSNNLPFNGCLFAPSHNKTVTHDWLDSNSLFCQLPNNQMALYVHQKEGLLNYKHVGTFEIEWETSKVVDENFSYTMHHFLWLRPDVILCSAISINHSYLCIIEVENLRPEVGPERLVVREVLLVNGDIHHIVPSPDINTAYLIVGKDVLKYTHDEGLTPTNIILTEFCDQVEVTEISGRHMIVTLGSRNRLCLNGTQVADNITSMHIHSEFLLLTTLQHALVCIRIDEEDFKKLSVSDLSVNSWGNEYSEDNTGFSMRRLERASSLVIAIPGDAKVILQLPRGNLEMIQPRALSIHIIKTHLDNLNYFQAFDIMRKQRINLNLIYDHNPSLFVTNAEKFIDQIKNPCWLNLFISDLQCEDVTDTIYKACYTKMENDVRKGLEWPVERKVELVCQLLKDIMEEKAAARNLIQPILTCLVKNKYIHEMEAALRKIKEFQEMEKTLEGQQKSADEAVKYLLYLVDVNVLFDISLGMYDLNLARFIASKSQKDPKEYLPYLDALAKLDENYRKFKINKDLKRYDSALEIIAKQLDKFDECLEMIREHNLYVKAVSLFPKETKEYKEVARLAGEYFSSNKKYREAGLMFQRSGNLDRALQVYKISGSWQDAIIISTEMNLSAVKLAELYRNLVDIMKDERRYRDAAEICLSYLKQPEETVSLLCEGKDWRDALKVAKTHKRLDLIETHVKPGVKEHADFILSKISQSKDDFMKHKKRLIVVRKQIAQREAQEVQERNEENEMNRMSDLLSETGSIADSNASVSSRSSRSSGRSYRSSKNRRKQERKVLSIKEGSLFEDLGLIRALHGIISTTYALKEEVAFVNRMLIIFFMDNLAERLQNALAELLSIIEKSNHEIWPKPETTENEGREGYVPPTLLEPKYTFPPDAKSINWKLDIFTQSITSHHTL